MLDGKQGSETEPETSESLRTFGAVLKALREEAGLTQEEFAPRVEYSVHYVAKIEQGKRFPPPRFIERAGAALECPRVLRAAGRHLSRRPGLASWFHQWAGIEEEAISLYAYECRVVPGLLQPESYIRAVFASRLPPLTDEQLEEQVQARLQRQRLLFDKPNTAFGFIMEQSLIDRHTGGEAVTRALVDHLLRLSTVRNVELQIMPVRQSDHAGLDGALYLAETPDNKWCGYIEGHDASALITASGETSSMQQRYGKMRAQAHSAEISASLLKELRGAL